MEKEIGKTNKQKEERGGGGGKAAKRAKREKKRGRALMVHETFVGACLGGGGWGVFLLEFFFPVGKGPR